MNYWLIKSEPTKYSWDKFVKDKITVWDGVRNYQARNNLREMMVGDQCFFYHSNEGKQILGIAEVTKQSYQDPTTEDPAWLVVELRPLRALKVPVTLEIMKNHPELKELQLVRNSRLSVSKVTKAEFNIILSLTE